MFKRKSLLLAFLVPAGILFAGQTTGVVKAIKTAFSNVVVVGWDIHGVLFKKHGHRGYQASPIQPTFELVKQLDDKGVKQVIMSNISCRSFKKLYKKYGESHFKYFSQIFISDNIGHSKPSKRYYQHVLRNITTNDGMCFKPSNLVFFDDKNNNVNGARKVCITAAQCNKNCPSIAAKCALSKLNLL